MPKSPKFLPYSTLLAGALLLACNTDSDDGATNNQGGGPGVGGNLNAAGDLGTMGGAAGLAQLGGSGVGGEGTGGAPNGGSGLGGSGVGGAGLGGASLGGAGLGGAALGGAALGGASLGGAGLGGAGLGGAGLGGAGLGGAGLGGGGIGGSDSGAGGYCYHFCDQPCSSCHGSTYGKLAPRRAQSSWMTALLEGGIDGIILTRFEYGIEATRHPVELLSLREGNHRQCAPRQ